MAAPVQRRLFGAICMFLYLMACADAAVSTADFAVNKWNDNMQGDVIVLDIGGMYYIGNHPMEPAITTADECAKQCNKMIGCNAFTFCSGKDGCGSGCAAFEAKPTTVVLDKDGYRVDSEKTKLPVLTFGPLNGGWRCDYDNKDAWAFGTCSLKKVKNPLKPTFWSGGKDQGWISGTINRPAKCGSFSTNVCRGCIKSTNSTACLACAKSARQVDFSGSTTSAEGCLVCYGAKVVGALRTRCVNCIKNKAACEGCTTTKYPKQCFDCVGKEGAASTGACVECASDYKITSEAQANRCYQKCLPKLRKQRCKTPGQSGCVDDYFCPVCSSSDGIVTACTNCALKNPSKSAKCGNCGLLADFALKCLECATPTSMTDDYVCTHCSSKLTKDIDACFKCAKNTKTKNSDRCGACPFYSSTLAGQDKCYKCLATNPADIEKTCFLNN